MKFNRENLMERFSMETHLRVNFVPEPMNPAWIEPALEAVRLINALRGNEMVTLPKELASDPGDPDARAVMMAHDVAEHLELYRAGFC